MGRGCENSCCELLAVRKTESRLVGITVGCEKAVEMSVMALKLCVTIYMEINRNVLSYL